ncbi:MAG TPA: transglycosylase SLT domain-containing protein [Anaerolineales bacterium]|nr:transglycosylase SLT domain-containing protein [Anaerolineales bacterium]
MPRARSINQDPGQTAAASENGSGCFSVYWLSPLAALFITFLLAAFALNAPIQTSALMIDMPALEQTLVVPTPQGFLSSLFDFSSSPSSSTSGISPIFTREVQYWGKDIVRWANAASIDPNLLAVVMQIESCGDPRAVSSAGASGLFQVMPFHFHLGENPFNPDTNALRGTNYLFRSLEAAAGNARLALAGYNGGIGVISRSEGTWSSQTHRYVRFGAPIYEDARNGATSSPTLNEWYRKYGAGLCRQAANRLGITE